MLRSRVGHRRRGDSLGTIRDEQGRAVRVLDPMLDWATGRQDRIRRKTLEAVVRELSGAALPDRRVIVAGVAIVGAGVVLVAATIGVSIYREGAAAAADLRQALLITGPAVVPMLIASVIVPFFVARRRRLAAARDVLLRHALCPHCGYDLSGAAGSTTITCPECACVWRAPRGGPAVVAAPRRSLWPGAVFLGILVLAVLGGVAAVLLS